MNATITALPVNAVNEVAPHESFLTDDRSSFNGESASGREARRASQTKLRLTRRGRAVFGFLAVVATGCALGLAAMMGAPGAAASNNQAEASDFAYVIVQPGESLWSVASSLDPAADPRDVISELIRLNQLDDSGVQAGQSIAVPLRYADSDGVLSAEQLGM